MRSIQRLESILIKIDSTDIQIANLLDAEVFAQFEKLRHLALRGSSSEIRKYLKVRSAQDPEGRRETKIQGAFHKASERINELYAKRVRPISLVAGRALRRRLGFDPLPNLPLVHFTDDCSFEAISNKEIPITYRRLFSTVPVEIEEFFVGRKEEKSLLINTYERFDSGRPASVLIYGNPGGGKTSFVDQTLRALKPKIPVDRMVFSQAIQSERQLAILLGDLLDEQSRSLDRLRARLRQSKERRIVIVEGLHNFFVRSLNGLETLKRFLLLVAETSHAFFWLVTIDEDAFHFLNAATDIDEFFTRTIELPPLTQLETQRLIRSRHNVSGYSLQFSSDLTQNSARWVLTEPRQDQLEDAFFQSLANYSGGHATLILYYWLRSLERLEGKNTIVISPFKPLTTTFIKELSEDKKLALATLILHGGLSLPNFAKAMRMTEAVGHATLTTLLQGNLVQIEAGRVDTYKVNAVLLFPIAEQLRLLHYL